MSISPIARVAMAGGVAIFVSVALALASTGGASTPPPGPSPRVEAMDGAFSDSPEGSEAVFRASGLEPGETVDGTVLVTNAGAGRGMFWLGPTGFSERPGPAGGKLSERLQVTVLDVTAGDAPMLVYTGAIADMGARPLGFVAPGKSRIYSMAATLLPGSPSRLATQESPYGGSSATVSLGWQAIAGRPPASARELEPDPPADTRAPRLRLEVPSRQRLLETGSLVVKVRCDEACRLDARGRLRTPGASSAQATAGRRAQARTPAALRLVLPPRARDAMREALQAGRSVPLAFTVEATDGAGNVRTARRTLTLRPGS